ncbi:MAG: hypothetical protein LBL07_16205 [Tannerella sp.]|jgi:hypothetical protein|nr:hypothetical protein [Tannerella sp.]
MTRIGRIFTANLCSSVRSVHLRAVLAGILLILPLTSLHDAPEKPAISRQPAGATYSKNAIARFYVNAYRIDGEYPEYQRYRSLPFNTPPSDAKLKSSPARRPCRYAYYHYSDCYRYAILYYRVEITNNRDEESDFIESALAPTRIADRTPEPQLTGTLTMFTQATTQKTLTGRTTVAFTPFRQDRARRFSPSPTYAQ